MEKVAIISLAFGSVVFWVALMSARAARKQQADLQKVILTHHHLKELENLQSKRPANVSLVMNSASNGANLESAVAANKAAFSSASN